MKQVKILFFEFGGVCLVLIGEPIPDAFAINTNFHASCWIRGEKSSYSPREGRKAPGTQIHRGAKFFKLQGPGMPFG